MSGEAGRSRLDNALAAQIAALVERRCGVVLEGVHRRALEDAVARRAAAQGFAGANDYAAHLLKAPPVVEVDWLAESILILETSFLRNPAHFRVLEEILLPALAAAGKALLIWSAGCATGEEPYSLAITCLESGLLSAGVQVRVLGTDISERALAAAQRGEYPERRMGRVSPDLRARYFDHVGGHWRVRDNVRALVSFQRYNLLDDALPVRPLSVDVIFCQNVTIYFRPEVTEGISHRLALALRDGGYLFPGYSEALWHAEPRLVMRRFGDCFLYERRRAGDTARPREWQAVGGRRQGSPAAVREPAAPADGRTADAAVPAPEPSHAGVPAEELAAARRASFEGKTARALEHAGRAVSMDPLLVEGWELLGLLHRQARHPLRAERAFRRQLYLAPDSPMAHFHLAGLYHESGRDADARREYANAARLLQAIPPDTVLGGVAAGLLLHACRRYIRER